MADTRIGPAGGLGGIEFDNYAVPTDGRLTEVRIFAGQYVQGVQFVYADAAGNTVEMPMIGGDAGTRYAFTLDAGEYLTGISGLTDWYIDRIRLHTNKRVSDDFGGTGTDVEYRLEAPAGEAIVGVFGRSNWYIDALGIVTRPVAPLGAAAPVAAPAPTAQPATTGGTPRPKDLEKIEGIGPKIAALLVSSGINDLGDLAGTPVERLKQILSAAGSRYAIADPTTWPEQAAYGARGDWAGLKALQNELRGGRRS
jgi:predicted flap endonuclease-1-like 5' DNA nuclease